MRRSVLLTSAGLCLGIPLLSAAMLRAQTPPAAPPANTPKAAEDKPADARPPLTVATDGFPAGNGTPEGVAADLARSFIQHDTALFKKTCIPAGTLGGDQYAGFLDHVVESMQAEAKRTTPSPMGPKAIVKVFAARPLSHDGPASFGYAVYGFKDVEFVDVKATQQNGETTITRTLVLQMPKGTWYVYPTPSLSQMLSDGLNDESASKKDFSEAYTVEKAKPAEAKAAP